MKKLFIATLILISSFLLLFMLKQTNTAESNLNNKADYTIEELMDLRRVDGIVEPVYTQDCFPQTLKNLGVSKDCFERANLDDDSLCSSSEIKAIKEYYKKGQENDPLNDGNGNFCADE